MSQVEEVLKRMEIIANPQRCFESGVIARHQAHTAIGGHPEAAEHVSLKRLKMRLPGLG
jgi:hypothetical protein